jgi:hypothetical protein
MNIRCVGKHCHDGPTDHDQPMPRWSAPGSLLCRRCTARLEQDLAELPAREQQVTATLDAAGGSGAERRGTPEPPVPLNIGSHDHLTLMTAAVVSWALLVREERGLRGPDRSTVTALAPWLLGQLDWITQQPWVDDMAEEIHDLSQVADAITRRKPLRNRLEPPCPACGARDLGRWDGASQVDCVACGAVWDERYYPALVRLVLDTSGGCVTAAEAAAELGITVSALRMLVSRGRLRKLGTVDGLARYSTSDLEQLKQDREAS